MKVCAPTMELPIVRAPANEVVEMKTKRRRDITLSPVLALVTGTTRILLTLLNLLAACLFGLSESSPTIAKLRVRRRGQLTEIPSEQGFCCSSADREIVEIFSGLTFWFAVASRAVSFLRGRV